MFGAITSQITANSELLSGMNAFGDAMNCLADSIHCLIGTTNPQKRQHLETWVEKGMLSWKEIMISWIIFY